MDKKGLGETVALAIRFLDDAIDMSNYPLDKITEMARGNRKIGLGVMGFADILYQMGIPYNSNRALSLAEDVKPYVQEESRKAIIALAEERGAFKNLEKGVFKDRDNCRYRNATTTTIAPTVTLRIIAGCSSGMCYSGLMSWAVTKTSLTSAGISSIPFNVPSLATLSMSSLLKKLLFLAIISKQGFTSINS